MRLYRPKRKVNAEFIKGPFSSPQYLPNEGYNSPEFPDGCYLVIEDGKGSYVSKEEFEGPDGFEPAKAPKAQASTEKKKGGSSSGSSGKKEKDKAAEAKG